MNMKFNIKHLSVFVAFLASICIVSCIDNKDVDWSEEKIVEISPEVVPVNIFGDPGIVDGILVKVEGDNQWQAYPINFIEGFDFEPGYFYVLKVKITHLANPPQDWYNVEYKLIELISKTEDYN